MANDPILTRLPQHKRSLKTRYGGKAPIQSRLNVMSPAALGALQRLDEERVNRGQSPFTNNEARVGGAAASQNRAITQAPDQGILQDFAADAGAIGSSLPFLPVIMGRELLALKDAPANVSDALGKANNPLEAVGNLADVPGIRMLPGSFTASQWGTGGAGAAGLADHPLMTALDLLPYGMKGAGATKTLKASTKLIAENATALDALPARARPLTTLLTKSHVKGPRISERPTTGVTDLADYTTKGKVPTARMEQYLEPNIIGKVAEAIGERSKASSLGQKFRQMGSKEAREAMRLKNRLAADRAKWAQDPDLAPDEATKIMATQVRDNIESIEKFETLTPESRAKVFHGLTRDALDRTKFTDLELDYADTYTRALDAMTGEQLKRGDLATWQHSTGVEYHDMATIGKLQRRAKQVELATAGEWLRSAIKDPTITNPTEVHGLMMHMLDDDTSRLTVKAKRNLADGYLTVLAQQGVDIKPLRRMLVGSKAKATPVTASLELFRGYAEDMILPHIVNPTPYAKAPKVLAKLDTTRLNKGTAHTYSDLARARTERALAHTERRSLPARWNEIVDDRAQTKIEQELALEYADDPDLDKILKHAATRAYGQVPENFKPQVRKIQAEMRDSWQELAAQGMQPTFVKRMTGQKVKAAFENPTIREVKDIKLSSTITRLYDASPSQIDPMMAVTAQALEYLDQKASTMVVDSYLTRLSTPGSSLIDRFASEVDDLHAANPILNRQEHMVNVIAAHGYKAFDPVSFVNGGTSKAMPALSQQIFLPTEVIKNLDMMKANSSLGKSLLHAPLNLFRTSVLPLSPRWQVNNIISGGVLTAAHANNPITIWKYSKQAWDMAKKDGGGIGFMKRDRTLLPDDPNYVSQATLDQAPPGGSQATEQRTLADLNAGSAEQMWHTASGATVARILKESWGASGGNLVKKAYQFNQTIDDMFRSMAFLEGKHSALKKGMTMDESVRHGIARAREPLQRFDTMTPIEREAMKMVFPFYSWTKSLLNIVAQYPTAHPVRMSVITQIAKIEQDDRGSGFPQKFREMFFIGQPDENGDVDAANLGGANPFADVGNFATLAGFLAGGEGDLSAVTSSMSPVLTTPLKAMGVNPSKGEADLYPDMYYDPVTGQMAMKQGDSLPLSMLNNLLPQSKLLTSALGLNQEFQDMARRDPEAAKLMLASAMGLPALRRKVNVPEAQIKEEVRRYNDQRDVRNKAMQTGDLDMMDKYPGLSAFKVRAEKLRGTKTNQKYTPDPQPPGHTIENPVSTMLGAMTKPFTG